MRVNLPGTQGDHVVEEGPALLANLSDGPGLPAHRAALGDLPKASLDDLLSSLDLVAVRGRGGAGFPFATKLETAARSSGRPSVVVNLSEGEPASHKDAALASRRPHLILDGAVLVAHALGARTVALIVPQESPATCRAINRALAERHDARVRFAVHRAQPSFVAGQSRAVIELMSGRTNLPVTAWQPEAVKGYRNRPTLLSNAETFAHLALLMLRSAPAYACLGTRTEPGTTLLTVHTGHVSRVIEVPFGTPWDQVLDSDKLDGPILLGGYHGTWAAPSALRDLTVSPRDLTASHLTLGAGVVLATGVCPVEQAADITEYLASQSARRCGPCFNGLPALAAAMNEIAGGIDSGDEVERLCALVQGRGACAHPDGTVRMIRSLVRSYRSELDLHAHATCSQRPATSALA